MGVSVPGRMRPTEMRLHFFERAIQQRMLREEKFSFYEYKHFNKSVFYDVLFHAPPPPYPLTHGQCVGCRSVQSSPLVREFLFLEQN